jgi:energy-converting hydrogenase Eha subunit C
VGSGVLAAALTFATTMAIMILGGVTLWIMAQPLKQYNSVMIGLFDCAMLGILIALWRLDRSMAEEHKQSWLCYAFFAICSLIPWTVKETPEMALFAIVEVIVLYAAYQRVLALRQRVVQSCRPVQM